VSEFLLECYAPRGGRPATLTGPVAARMTGVRVRWAVLAPDDELTLWVLEAASRSVLESEMARLGVEGHLQDAVPLA
jgi:hypothetical protein